MQKNLTIKQVTDEIIIKRKMTLTSLATVLGISPSHLTHIRNGKIKLPKKKQFWDLLTAIHGDQDAIDALYAHIHQSISKEPTNA